MLREKERMEENVEGRREVEGRKREKRGKGRK